MALWQRVLLLCAVFAAAVGVSITDGGTLVTQLNDTPVATEEARPPNPNPQDDRHFGQVEEEMQQAKIRAHSRKVEAQKKSPQKGNEKEENEKEEEVPSAPKVPPLATKWNGAMKKESEKQAKNDQEKSHAVYDAAMNAAITTQNIAAVPLEYMGSKEKGELNAADTELRKATRDLSHTKQEQAYVEKLEKGIAEHGAPAASAAPGAKPVPADETPYADLWKMSQKLGGQMDQFSQDVKKQEKRFAHVAQQEAETAAKPCGVNDMACRERKAAAKKDRLSLDKQYAFDKDENADLDKSPTFANVEKAEEKDEQMQQRMKDEEAQYKKLKKTGKLEPLPKHEPKETDKLLLAKRWEQESAQHDKADAKVQKGYEKFDARFMDGQRTDFQDEAPVKFVSSPAAEALYKKLKAEQHSGIPEALAKLRQVEYDESKEHMQMLKDAIDKSPSKKTVSELVKEGAAGALRLQQEMAMQEKIEARNANLPPNSTKAPMTLEEELKKHKLKEVTQWQAATVLKEGQDAVTKAAEQLEVTGSKADLAVLEANSKRFKLGKPPLSASEANLTISAEHEEEQIKKDLGAGEEYQHYQRALNVSEARMARDTKALTAGAKATGELEMDENYSGDADELLPDSENDPMLHPSIDYGHAYEVSTYEPEDDDNHELEALDLPMASITDGSFEAKEEDDENEKDMPLKQLLSEYSDEKEADLATDEKQTHDDSSEVDTGADTKSSPQ